MGNLQDKIVIITGGAGGIGSGMAKAMWRSNRYYCRFEWRNRESNGTRASTDFS